MWDVFARLRLFALGLGVLAAGSVVEASVISFKAVKKNDVAIVPPLSTLTVLANDKIEVDLFLSGWINDFPNDAVPNNVRTFQVKIDRARYVSPDPVLGNGSVKPLGWCGPVDKIACTNSTQCPAEYPVCLTSPPTGCTCSPHTPSSGASMNTSRSDFLFNAPPLMDGIYDVDTSNIDFKYFGIANDGSVPDTGVPRYLGTLVLKVSANACGTFTIGFVQEVSTTFISDPSPKAISLLPSMQPLTLTVSDCSRQLLSCNPGHCNIDARIAHDRLNQDIKLNTNLMVMTFSKSTTSPNMTAADFEVTVLPNDPLDPIPVITALSPNVSDPKITTVIFNRRIQQTRWTCIRDKGSNKRCCIGSLPADADNSRISQQDDMFELVNNLKGCLNPPSCNEPLLTVEKFDTDRSVLGTGADLLMLGDLLNGADAFDPVPGNSLPLLVPSCPDMRLPP